MAPAAVRGGRRRRGVVTPRRWRQVGGRYSAGDCLLPCMGLFSIFLLGTKTTSASSLRIESGVHKAAALQSVVMPGLDPGIHVFLHSVGAWMAGTSPAMTAVVDAPSSLFRRLDPFRGT